MCTFLFWMVHCEMWDWCIVHSGIRESGLLFPYRRIISVFNNARAVEWSLVVNHYFMKSESHVYRRLRHNRHGYELWSVVGISKGYREFRLSFNVNCYFVMIWQCLKYTHSSVTWMRWLINFPVLGCRGESLESCGHIDFTCVACQYWVAHVGLPNQRMATACRHALGPLLLTWFNFNTSMDK